MTKEEAKRVLQESEKTYQPVPGFLDKCKRDIGEFHKRIMLIADYCGHDSSYIVAGCAEGYNCFALAELGAKVLGVDGCTGNKHLARSLLVAEATAVLYGIDKNNPRFVKGTFPQWLEDTGERPDWLVMLMVLHNMLKGRKLAEICSMINRIEQIVGKGFVMSSRAPQLPQPALPTALEGWGFYPISHS